MNLRRLFVLALGVLAVVYVAAMFLMQRWLLFPKPAVGAALRRPPDAAQVWLATRAGRVEAWYLPPLNEPKAAAPVTAAPRDPRRRLR
jgi:hypothetical protein